MTGARITTRGSPAWAPGATRSAWQPCASERWPGTAVI